MPEGKPAGTRCIQLSDDDRCLLFGHPDRPEVCASLQPHPEMCLASARQALAALTWLEDATRPTR